MPDLYCTKIDLPPENPLKNVNSYIIVGDKRNLIIDTAFNHPLCLEQMKKNLNELKIDMNRTDIFITHLHADHSGLASQIASDNSRIYASAADKGILALILTSPEVFWKPRELLYMKEGYPTEELTRTRINNPARKYASKKRMNISIVEDGMHLIYGNYKLKCISTPGHTPGHMCLYDEDNQILFTGDHLLYDITPNITAWETLPNSLSCYLQSLNKISGLKVNTALTGHRSNTGNFYDRICELQKHHAERLNDIKQIIAKYPGINGYEIASHMKWSIRVKSWDDFPPGQRWFAVGEAIAHLNYLVDNNMVVKNEQNDIYSYTLP